MGWVGGDVNVISLDHSSLFPFTEIFFFPGQSGLFGCSAGLLRHREEDEIVRTRRIHNLGKAERERRDLSHTRVTTTTYTYPLCAALQQASRPPHV
jgi:hypothetical protein